MPKLLRDLKSFYQTQKRDLPWRRTKDPYKILVSEIMLQQTQVERVLPFYAEFTKRFPTPQTLAKAPLSEVLKVWSGLGYNRRAKYLHSAAKEIASALRLSAEFLESLPGVGHYTARAVAVFAYNKPEIFIETNIRTVFLYYCFPHKIPRSNFGKKISDKEILPLIEEVLKKSKMQPRDFYAALMDYGSYLKKKGIKLNMRSKHYTKQSKFEGSYRQLRGQILRALLEKSRTMNELIDITDRKHTDVARVIASLSSEGLIKIKNKKISIAQ